MRIILLFPSAFALKFDVFTTTKVLADGAWVEGRSAAWASLGTMLEGGAAAFFAGGLALAAADVDFSSLRLL